MIVLLRALTRLVGMVWMIALALLCLGIAGYCFDGLVSLGSARPDRVARLPAVRGWTGHFLDRLQGHGPTAGLALLCGLGAMLLGALLLVGTLRSRQQRLVVLEHGASGAVAARARTLRTMAMALAERARGATNVKRPKLSLSRRGTRGRLTLNASRTRTSKPQEVEAALTEAVAPISEPFGLRPRVRVRLGGRGERVQ